jgi:hypothetical protein
MNGASYGRGVNSAIWFSGNPDRLCGSTPMIVYGLPSSVTDCPIASGLPA